MKGLIIVESPAKAKTISKFLNNEYQIKASMGHIRDLPEKELGVDIDDNFKAHYVTPKAKADIIKQLREAAKDAKEIFLASDHDREGEAIAWHLSEVLKKEIKDKPLFRITFNEITKSAITSALETPGKIDMDKVDAQQARRILDRIVGYKISPLLWKIIATSLSAGRVQSVALRMVCERDQDIEKFVPEEYWSLEAKLTNAKGMVLEASYYGKDGKKVNIPDEKTAEEIMTAVKAGKFSIASVEEKDKKTHPAAPYITSTLQQDAARLLNFSPKRTMQLAQDLYEGVDINGDTLGLITYMRTDSLRISDEALQQCRELITQRFGKGDLNPKPYIFKNKSTAQDAHEAIRPTDPFHTPESLTGLNPDLLKLYTIIWQRFVATQMKPAIATVKKIEIVSDNGHTLKTSGSLLKEEGFLKAYPYTKVADGVELDRSFSVNTALDLTEIKGKQHFTEPPARFTEASLIKELESQGIGRPSTYAVILNTIVERQYVALKEKKLFPSPLGKAVNLFLTENFDKIFSSTFTASMEEKLDSIEFGKVKWQELLKTYYNSIKKQIDKVDVKKSKGKMVETTDILCDKCGKPMVARWGRNGQFLACSNFPTCSNRKNFYRDDEGTIKLKEEDHLKEKCPECGNELMIKQGRFGKFIACSNYPKCRYTSPLTNTKEQKAAKEEITGEKCPVCGQDLVLKQGRYGSFIACSNYPKCTHTAPLSTGVKCPKCQIGDVLEKRSKKGKMFYGCSKYPECDFVSFHKPVNLTCPECGNAYLEEVKNKEKIIVKKCPKCGKELQ